MNSEASKIGFVADKQAIYASMVELLIDMGEYTEAFNYTERAKSRSLVDLLASKQEFGTKSTQITELNNFLHDLNEQELMGKTDSKEENQTNRLRGLKRSMAQLKKDAPEVASLISVNTLSLSEVQQRLFTDETLLEFYGDDNNLFVFIVNKNNIESRKLDGTNLAGQVEQFREQMLSPNNEDYLKTAQALYLRLIQPVKAELKTKKVLIVAHGPLHYVPFNALHDGKHFLIDEFSVRILPSASVLAYLNNNHSVKENNLLALGNPDLGNAEFDLPGAEQEVKAVARSFNNSRLMIRGKATETEFKQLASGYRYLHVASHGEFNAEQPLESRLLLTSDEKNDGNLTVREIYDLPLNAELVILSACETGLGNINKGDDVVGLTRGFLFAGTRSIISSLWVVDDAATKKLMVDFYQDINRAGKQEALRQAQLTIKKDYREHPFYWAAFQLTGDGS